MLIGLVYISVRCINDKSMWDGSYNFSISNIKTHGLMGLSIRLTLHSGIFVGRVLLSSHGETNKVESGEVQGITLAFVTTR